MSITKIRRRTAFNNRLRRTIRTCQPIRNRPGMRTSKQRIPISRPIRFLLRHGRHTITTIPRLPFRTNRMFIMRTIHRRSHRHPLTRRTHAMIRLRFRINRPLRSQLNNSRPSSTRSKDRQFKHTTRHSSRTNLVGNLRQQRQNVVLRVRITMNTILSSQRSTIRKGLSRFVPTFITRNSTYQVIVNQGHMRSHVTFTITHIRQHQATNIGLPFHRRTTRYLRIRTIIIRQRTFRVRTNQLRRLRQLSMTQQFHMCNNTNQRRTRQGRLRHLRHTKYSRRLTYHTISTNNTRIHHSNLTRFKRTFKQQMTRHFSLIHNITRRLPPRNFQGRP